MPPKMLRMVELRAGQYSKSRSGIYWDIQQGLMVPPISLGPRCSRWPEDEVEAIVAARIAGASESEIRELVARLMLERAKAFARLLATRE